MISHYYIILIYITYSLIISYSLNPLLFYIWRSQSIYANIIGLFRFPNCSNYNDLLLQENNGYTSVNYNQVQQAFENCSLYCKLDSIYSCYCDGFLNSYFN